MTKKDFELIAAALRAARLNAKAGIIGGSNNDHLDNTEAGVDDALDQLCYRLKEANPRFDVARFRKACEA